MTNPSLTPPAGSMPEPSQTAGDPRFSLDSLLAGIRKNWWLVLAVTVVVSTGVIFYTLGQTKVYEASAVVMFDAQPARPLGQDVDPLLDYGAQYWNNKEYYKTQIWIIQSRRIRSAVVQELGLEKNADFLNQKSSSGSSAPQSVSVDAAADRLASRLSVEPMKDSRLAVVKYKDADPARAQQVVAALVDTYVQGNLDDATQSTDMAADWLRSQVGGLKEELEKSEMSLHEYKKDKNILSVSMDDQSNMLRGEMQQLNSTLTSVRARIVELEARNEQLKKVPSDNPHELPATELLASQALQRFRTDFVEASRELEDLTSQGKGVEYPAVKAASARREITRQVLMGEIRNIQGSVESNLAALRKEAAGLQQLYDAAQTRALELNLLEIEYNRLKRSKENNEKLYSLVTERSKESDLTKMLRINNVRVVERPVVPKSPVSPNVPTNIAGGLIAGLVLGLAAAIGRAQLDRTIKAPDEAERELGVSFLGLLPALAQSEVAPSGYGNGRRRKRKRGEGDTEPWSGPPELVVHAHPTSGAAEAARAIRTNILFMSPDRPYRTLLVTSAGPAEGKTTVACCIAIAMAQAGRRVVLLDCDMRRPRLHRVFGLEKTFGITTALLDLSTANKIAHPTEIPNLSVVTTGPLPPNPAELLHSEAFTKLLAALREQFDCVVIDSPPVVPVTDAAVLSTHTDGTVLVVRAFRTSKDLAHRAVRSIRDVGGPLIGTVLNALDLKRNNYGYRYQYYYYYQREGYAADEETPAVNASRSQDGDPAPPPGA